jgi:peptidyl-prolyl cis-trans isomerase SurA
MKEDASIELLVNEAAERVKKDVHISIDDKEIGWITAFVLPYEVENAAYNTAPGKSATFKTTNGEHTLKNIEEREAIGSISIAQILLAFRPDATEADKQKIAQRADSLYNALNSGADFGAMVEKYSDDNLTYQAKGEMPLFGVGKYDPVFENAAFALEKDGELSKPFQTSFGYHIIKRLARVPVSENKEEIKEKVLTSDRMQVAHAVLVKNIRETIKNDATAGDLSSDSAVLEYYRNNLEKYNSEFADQLNEFRQGNLLFAIMQKKVWDVASTDSAGLVKYYNEHKDKYFWENSADALIVTALNTETPPEEIQGDIKNNATQWRAWAEGAGGNVQVDSGRFELSQIPVVGRTNFTEGLVTAPVLNNQDSSRTLAYIIKLHPDKELKRFEDAKGFVINDYQLFLEEQWLADLKRKYPVKVNKKLFKKLP